MNALRTGLQRGMTLIELMVVIAIIALLITVGAVSLSAIRGADVDATGSILSGAMTYLSSRAVHDNKTYRLVIDMNEHRFWSEATNDDDPCSRYLPDEAEAGVGSDQDAKKKAQGEEGETEEGAGGGGFTQKKDALLQKHFEADTNVTQILTAHHTEPQTEGRAAIYFYPNGQAERALVWIGGKDADQPTGWETEITLELHSLGAVTYHGNPVDERDFDLAKPEEVP